MIHKEAKLKELDNKRMRLTSSCRDGLFQLLKHEGNTGTQKILLPAYVGLSLEEGSGILDPVKATGTPFEFYNIGSRLSPDLEDLKTKIEANPNSIVLLVNYLGWKIENRNEALKICNSYGIRVVEDNAHLLGQMIANEETNLNSNYQIYSIHKFLGTNGGGAVKSIEPIGDISETMSKEDLVNLAKTPLESLLSTRMSNYIELKKRLIEIDSKQFKFFFESNPDTALNFPILFESKKERQDLYKRLTQEEIYPTALYHRLVPEISRYEFPLSHNVSDRILNLPIHQDISSQGLDKMCCVIEGSL